MFRRNITSAIADAAFWQKVAYLVIFGRKQYYPVGAGYHLNALSGLNSHNTGTKK
ncbi:MAG: hypothetical protein LBF88_12885 [Planctomycetaceae bacterium]|jgi:hypothetical protein|nr:hypothetical protein [Planctomycetaceae bacterium]